MTKDETFIIIYYRNFFFLSLSLSFVFLCHRCCMRICYFRLFILLCSLSGFLSPLCSTIIYHSRPVFFVTNIHIHLHFESFFLSLSLSRSLLEWLVDWELHSFDLAWFLISIQVFNRRSFSPFTSKSLLRNRGRDDDTLVCACACLLSFVSSSSSC